MTTMTIRVDYENNAPSWWDAVRAVDLHRLPIDAESVSLLNRLLHRGEDEITLPVISRKSRSYNSTSVAFFLTRLTAHAIV